MSDLYEADIAAWAEQQADALRRRAANEIDWENVAEEIESLARSDRREIRNRLAVICEHLLKWAYQPQLRSGSWRGSVVEPRDARCRSCTRLTIMLATHRSAEPGASADTARQRVGGAIRCATPRAANPAKAARCADPAADEQRAG